MCTSAIELIELKAPVRFLRKTLQNLCCLNPQRCGRYHKSIGLQEWKYRKYDWKKEKLSLKLYQQHGRSHFQSPVKFTMAQNGPPHLTISTSLSMVSSSSSSWVLNTPQNAATTLREFCVSLKLTPPAKSDKIAMDQIKHKVNDLLAPINVTWDQLSSLKQAKISFLVMRKQHIFLFQQSQSASSALDTAQALYDSLDENSFYGKRLHAFVRNVDVLVRDDGEFAMNSPYEVFLSNHTEWLNPETAPTIFNNPDGFKRVTKPLLWLQEETSTVCSLVSIGNAIFYSQCMHNGTGPDDTALAVGQNALNVSRFMRDEFTDEEVFANIFLHQGGYPCSMVERLLKPQNPDVRVMRNIRLFGDSSVDFIFELMKNSFREFGALIIERFQVYPDFLEDNGQLVFHGDWGKKEKLAENENKTPHHALLIVGVRRTSNVKEMGGLAFLAQNSWAKKPFVIIGYDLLLSMGVKDLLAIEEGLKFDTGEWNHDTVSPALIQSGSPRIFDIPDGQGNQSFSLAANKGSLDVDDEAASTCYARYWQRIDPNEISHIIT